MSSYIPIASQTLGSSASSVTFSSIPTTLNGKTLRDLVVVVSAKPVASGDYFMQTQFNSNTSGYLVVIAEGTPGGVASVTQSGSSLYFINNTSDFNSVAGGLTTLQIFDYAQTNKHKSVLARLNNPGSYPSVLMGAGRWANTAAITSMVLTLTGTSFAAGSTFSLYGIEG
jgi:hypothetical protein